LVHTLALTAMAGLLAVVCTAATTRPATASTGPTLSALAAGAGGDGVHDDAPALRRALGSLGAQGGTILIPPGTYLLRTGVATGDSFPNGDPILSALVIDGSDIQLLGAGAHTILMLAPATKMRAVTVKGSRVRIGNLIVDGNSTHRRSDGGYPNADVVDGLVYAQAASNTTVTDCEVRNGIEDGVGGLSADGMSITRCRIHDNGTAQAGGNGIAVGGSNDSVSDSAVTDNTAAGVLLKSPGPMVVSNTEISGNAKGGIDVSSTGVSIKDDRIRGNGRQGFPALAIRSSDRVTVSSDVIVDNQSTGISVSGSSAQITIVGNTCSNSTAGAPQLIGIHVGPAARAVSLRQNTCNGNGHSVSDQILIDAGADVNADWASVNTVGWAQPTPSWLKVLLPLAVAAILASGFLAWRLSRPRRRGRRKSAAGGP
jgi:parallel beta-helix repeat protein